MKRVLYIGIAAAIAVGCTELSDPGAGGSSENLLSITVSTSSQSSDSRVSLESNESGGLSVTWADESELLSAWSPSQSSLACFSMVEGSLSDDKESASFEGTDPEGTMRLIHPYQSEATVSASGEYTIDLSAQSIDIETDNGLSSMSSSTYMVSELFESSDVVSPSMKHVGAALKVGLRFEGLTTMYEDRITKILIGGNNGLDLPTTAKIDLNEDVDSDDFCTTTSTGTISIDVSGSPVVTNYDDSGETFYVNFNTLPFTIEPDDKIMLGVELTDEDGYLTQVVFSITYNGTSDFEIPRASYTSLNYYCTIAVEVDAYIFDWWDKEEIDASLTESDGDMTMDQFISLNPYTMPACDVWTISGDATAEQLALLSDTESRLLEVVDEYLDSTDRKISLIFSDLTTIPDYALYNYNFVMELSAPKATSIGDYACYVDGAKSIITSISLPEVTTIGEGAFREALNIVSFSAPKVESIGDSAFNECSSIKSLSFPEVTYAGVKAFYNCTRMTEISLPKLESLSDYLFQVCDRLESISIPNVTTIGEGTFDGCQLLKSISLPLITTIPDYAFRSCYALESVDIPEATTVGCEAFAYCYALESISLPLITTIPDRVFAACDALESVDFPEITTIGEYAFHNCRALKSVSFPEVTAIGEGVFEECEVIESISLPSVTTIEEYAFSQCYMLNSIELATNSGVMLVSLDEGLFDYVDIENNTTLTIGAANASYIDGSTLTVGDYSYTFNEITLLNE